MALSHLRVIHCTTVLSIEWSELHTYTCFHMANVKLVSKLVLNRFQTVLYNTGMFTWPTGVAVNYVTIEDVQVARAESIRLLHF